MKVLRVLCPNLTDDPGFTLDCSFGIVSSLTSGTRRIDVGKPLDRPFNLGSSSTNIRILYNLRALTLKTINSWP